MTVGGLVFWRCVVVSSHSCSLYGWFDVASRRGCGRNGRAGAALCLESFARHRAQANWARRQRIARGNSLNSRCRRVTAALTWRAREQDGRRRSEPLFSSTFDHHNLPVEPPPLSSLLLLLTGVALFSAAIRAYLLPCILPRARPAALHRFARGRRHRKICPYLLSATSLPLSIPYYLLWFSFFASQTLCRAPNLRSAFIISIYRHFSCTSCFLHFVVVVIKRHCAGVQGIGLTLVFFQQLCVTTNNNVVFVVFVAALQ